MNKINFPKKGQPFLFGRPFDLRKFRETSDNTQPLRKLPTDEFDWHRWRLGIAVWREIGVACRKEDIFAQAKVLRHYAIGYLPGENLICRPKENEVAVMFLIDNEFCWTHLRKEEFDYVFIVE